MDELREQLQKDVNEIMDSELAANESIKEKIYNEIVKDSNLVPEEIARAAVDKVFFKLNENDSYLVINDVIEETMKEINTEYGEDPNNEKHYHKLYSDLQDKFEQNRKELIENGFVTDIINFDDIEATFDELNDKVNETQKYLDEFFYIRDQKVAVIKDTSLTIEEKKEKIAQINENSILNDIENPDVKREYELFNASSDEVLMGIFSDENLTPEQMFSEIQKYENDWKDMLAKTYEIDIQNMDILSKQIDVVMDNTETELANEYKAIFKELGLEKGSEEEKIFDAAFENNCNEQEYIDKMLQIKMAEDETIIQIDNELAQVEAELLDLDTRLGEMSEEEIVERRKELKAQRVDLLSRKADAISNLKESLVPELHARFERMANYQKKALRFVALKEKFDKQKQMNKSGKQYKSLNDAMNYKNKQALKNMQDKVSLNQENNMEELAQIHDKNKETAAEKSEELVNENTSVSNEEIKQEKSKPEWHPKLTQDQIDEMIAEGIEPGDQEYYQYLANIGIKLHNNIEEKQNEKVKVDNTKEKWHENLSQDQIDELKAEGIEPGDPEYYQYLKNHGINTIQNVQPAQEEQNEEKVEQEQQPEENKTEEKNNENKAEKKESKQKNNGGQVVVQQAAPKAQDDKEEKIFKDSESDKKEQTALRNLSEAESAKNIIDDFLKTSGVYRKKFFAEDGYVKLADAVAAIKDNDEGIKLSRKERKEITEALDSHLKNSLNETEVKEKNGDIIALFDKIQTFEGLGSSNLSNEDKTKLFEDLYTYNENKLPCIATSYITKENRDKLTKILEGYGEMLKDGNLTEAEIKDFDTYIINPLNANNIRHEIEEMGFWPRTTNKLKSIFNPNYNKVQIGRALNSELKNVNEIKAEIKAKGIPSGPSGLSSATYSLDEIVVNDVNRTNNEKNKAPKAVTGQVK